MSEVDTTHVIPVNELNFESEVINSNVPVLVDVSATWCGPCKMARPVVAELARTHRGALKVVEIDGDDSPGLVARLGVRGFPTFVGILGGEVVERRAGFGGKRPLDELATSLVRKNQEQSA
ncbi:MAG: thioredoxin family protein [Myxococcota bacterium]